MLELFDRQDSLLVVRSPLDQVHPPMLVSFALRRILRDQLVDPPWALDQLFPLSLLSLDSKEQAVGYHSLRTR